MAARTSKTPLEWGKRGPKASRRADGDGARSRIPSQDCPGVTHHRRDLSEQVALGKSRPPKGHLSPSQVSPSQVSPSQLSPSQLPLPLEPPPSCYGLLLLPSHPHTLLPHFRSPSFSLLPPSLFLRGR